MSSLFPNFNYHDISPQNIAQGKLSPQEKIVLGKHLADQKKNPIYADFFKSLIVNEDLSKEKLWEELAINYVTYVKEHKQHRETALFHSALMHQKGKTSDYTVHALKQLFGINLDDEKIAGDKIEFLFHFLSTRSEIRTLDTQRKNIPLITEALAFISKNLEKWPVVLQEGYTTVLERQLHNLKMLSQMLQPMPTDEARELTLQGSLKRILEPFLKGEKLITSQDLHTIEKESKSYVEQQRIKIAESQKAGKRQPIRATSLKTQIDLQKTTRSTHRALAYMAKQNEIKQRDITKNVEVLTKLVKSLGILLDLKDIPVDSTLKNLLEPFVKGEKLIDATALQNLENGFKTYLRGDGIRQINSTIIVKILPKIDHLGLEKIYRDPEVKKLIAQCTLHPLGLITSSGLKEVQRIVKDAIKNAGLTAELSPLTSPEKQEPSVAVTSRGDSTGGQVFQFKNLKEFSDLDFHMAESFIQAQKDLEAIFAANPSAAKSVEETVGFFKQGHYESPDTSRFETFVFKIADLIGLGDQFAGTKMEKLPAERVDIGSTKKGLVYRPEKEASAVGSLQVPQSGDDLMSYYTNPSRWQEIKPPTLQRSILTSAVMGMYDLNLKNAIVTSENGVMTPKFFDNSRILPHGNGFIRMDARAFSTTRCALLGHPAANEPMSAHEKKELQDEVIRLKEEVQNKLKPYLASTLKIKGKTQSTVPNLPEHWFDTKAVLESLDKRLTQLEKAFSAGKIKIPRDIVFAADPAFKFVCAATLVVIDDKNNLVFQKAIDQNILTTKERESYFKAVSVSAGYYDLDQLLDSCIRQGIDAQAVWNMCKDENITLEEIFNYMIYRSKDRFDNENNKKIMTLAKKNGDQLRNDLFEAAPVDFKDVDRTTIPLLYKRILREDCRRNHIPFLEKNNPDLIKREKDKLLPFKLLITIDEKKQVTAWYKNEDSTFIEVPLDIKKHPGKVAVLSSDVTDDRYVPVHKLAKQLMEMDKSNFKPFQSQ